MCEYITEAVLIGATAAPRTSVIVEQSLLIRRKIASVFGCNPYEINCSFNGRAFTATGPGFDISGDALFQGGDVVLNWKPNKKKKEKLQRTRNFVKPWEKKEAVKPRLHPDAPDTKFAPNYAMLASQWVEANLDSLTEILQDALMSGNDMFVSENRLPVREAWGETARLLEEDFGKFSATVMVEENGISIRLPGEEYEDFDFDLDDGDFDDFDISFEDEVYD